MRRLNPISGDASAILADSADDLSHAAARPADAAAPPVRPEAVERDPLTIQSGPVLYPGKFAETWLDRIEAFISRLSMRDNFWHAICSFVWLPLAFFSGIKMKQVGEKTFAAVLPFRRFNRNWYRAMAGGALLANSEIAAGMYVFGACGGGYSVVCKDIKYTFLRPCSGPAVYRMTPRENIRELLERGGEFNITLDLEITQQASRIGERDKRVGRSEATYHVTPRVITKRRAARRRPGA